MKILLINPGYQKVYGKSRGIAPSLPSLGLAYLAAVLDTNKHVVKIVDTQGVDENAIRQTIIREEPELVGIIALTPVIYEAFNVARIVKEISDKIWVVIGGPHPTVMPEESIQNPYIDFVVRGEGEETLLELVNSLGSGKEPDNIRGITLKKDGGIVQNPGRDSIKDLDSLPFPAYHLLPMSSYSSVQTKRGRFALILTSRGCPYQCVYCNKKIFGNKFRVRSPENILAEIEFLIENYAIREFHIVDDIFTLDKKRVETFCDLIQERHLDISWKCPNGVRVDSVTKELLAKMKEAGCYSVSFGIESGNQRILDNIKKRIILEQSKNAVQWAKQAGIFTICFFMFGNLGEDRETMEETIEFAKSLGADVAQFMILVPYPGTEVRQIMEAEGRIFTDNWEEYGNLAGKAIFEHGKLTKPLMEDMFKKAYRHFYYRPGYILHKILDIRSLSDVRFRVKGLSSVLRTTR